MGIYQIVIVGIVFGLNLLVIPILKKKGKYLKYRTIIRLIFLLCIFLLVVL